MPYRKLSEQVQRLSNPQRSDAFVKAFKEEVREGEITAAYIPERFALPKEFSRRGGAGSYSKDSRDMLFDATSSFEKWFENINKELATARRGGKVKVTAQNIEAGLVDFKALAQQTRARLHNSYSKGQRLGNTRKKQTPAKTASRGKKK